MLSAAEISGIGNVAWRGRCWPYLPDPTGGGRTGVTASALSASDELIERSSDSPP